MWLPAGCACFRHARKNVPPSTQKCMRLTVDPARLLVIRRRLADLSWLMRCLAEPIARRANREDACKSRFWEGRFKAQRLCNERALLAAMAYVDLNPLRAGIAKELEDSAHTSVALRMERTKDRRIPQIPLGPILGVLRPAMSLSEQDYLQLLDWTGRQFVQGKRGRIAAAAPAALQRIAVAPDRWTMQVRGISCGYWRAVGSLHDLADLAKTLGQRFAVSVG